MRLAPQQNPCALFTTKATKNPALKRRRKHLGSDPNSRRLDEGDSEAATSRASAREVAASFKLGNLVELRGIEPRTSCVQGRRSPS